MVVTLLLPPFASQTLEKKRACQGAANEIARGTNVHFCFFFYIILGRSLGYSLREK